MGKGEFNYLLELTKKETGTGTGGTSCHVEGWSPSCLKGVDSSIMLLVSSCAGALGQ